MDDIFSPVQRCAYSKTLPPKRISLVGASESEILEALKTHCNNPQPVPTSPTSVKNIEIPEKKSALQNIQNCLSKFRMDPEERAIAEKILSHWARNDLHAMPVYTGTHDEFANDFRKYGYTVEPYSEMESVYHTHKTKKAVKYRVLNEDGTDTGWEYVFDDESGKIVTAIEDAGTYNIFSPTGIYSKYKHKVLDVDPYFDYGSGPGDSTSVSERKAKTTEAIMIKINETAAATQRAANSALKMASEALSNLID